MTDLNDILGKKDDGQEDWFPIGGICEECYYPLDLGMYYPEKKKLKVKCDKGHINMVDMDLGNGDR